MQEDGHPVSGMHFFNLSLYGVLSAALLNTMASRCGLGFACPPNLLDLCEVTILLFLPPFFFSFSPFSGVSSSVSDFSISVSEETFSSESSDTALLFLDFVSFFFLVLAGESFLFLDCLSLFLEFDCGLLLFRL